MKDERRERSRVAGGPLSWDLGDWHGAGEAHSVIPRLGPWNPAGEASQGREARAPEPNRGRAKRVERGGQVTTIKRIL